MYKGAEAAVALKPRHHLQLRDPEVTTSQPSLAPCPVSVAAIDTLSSYRPTCLAKSLSLQNVSKPTYLARTAGSQVSPWATHGMTSYCHSKYVPLAW